MSANSEDAPSLELVGKSAPTVDIFLTYCGEGMDVICDTMYAACNLDYPATCFRVIILDDACSDELRDLITSLGAKYPNLFYSTRGRRPKIHSKAANMNHGLEFTNSLPGGPSEYTAGLDADNIPERIWLRRVVPHLAKDDGVGAVSVPGRAYNVPQQDTLQTSLEPRFLYGVVLPVAASCGHSVIIGTGFVVRRSALDSVGGFPTESVTDDGLLTLKLKARGWDVVWVQEYVQWNLVTDTLQGQIKQRQRWVAGAVDSMIFAATNNDTYWSFQNRVNIALGHFMALLPPLLVPLILLSFALAVASNRPMIEFYDPEDMRFLLTLSIIDIAAQLFHGFLVASFSSTPIPTLYHTAKQWVVPYLFFGLINHYFPKQKPQVAPDFQPASVFRADITAPKPRESAVSAFLARVKSIIAQPGGFINISYLVLVVLGTINAVASARGPDFAVSMQQFVTASGWPPLLLSSLSHIVNVWVLVAYAVQPPPVIQRNELLKRERNDELAYPSDEALKTYAEDAADSEWWLGGFAGYCAVLGIALAMGTI